MQLTFTKVLFVAFASTVLGQGPYTQCGGTGWSGSTSCSGGWECICQNPWYSQCLPAGSAQSGCSGGSGSPGSSSISGISSSTSLFPMPIQQTEPSPAAGGPAEFYNANPGGSSSTMAVVPSSSPSASSVPAVAGGSQATTTHYTITSQSACGCNGGWQSSAGPGIYAAAGTLNLFGTGRGGPTYCGTGCGSCFQLTSTGASPPGEGTSGQPTNSIIVMITDLCPASGNTEWCSQPTNQYGFGAHFDIINPPTGWNNPIVDYAPIACPASLTSNFDSCKCANGGL